MKKAKIIPCLPVLAALLTGCGDQGGIRIWTVLLLVLALPVLAFGGLRIYSIVEYNRHRNRGGRRRRARKIDPMTWGILGLGALLVVLALIIPGPASEIPEEPTEPETQETQAVMATEETEMPIIPPEVHPVRNISPVPVLPTTPESYNIRWEIFTNGKLTHTYNRETPIYMGHPDEYFALPGVATFRGNNYRNNPAYGTADITQGTISLKWTAESSTLENGAWSGSGWTGQPLVVRWDPETRAIMTNMYPEKQAKKNLVEVIYATLDGRIYFLDLDDGSATRDPLNVGMCFKGAGALDPRGYPLMYVGSGDEIDGKRPRMFIISLIDGTILYEHGYEEKLAYRKDSGQWCAFDSSPLVDAETDTLIWPGENGVLYTIKLNTAYDKAAGTLSIQPDAPVMTRYLTGATNMLDHWVGYEASACIVDHYLYTSENGGMFYCVDLNNMELVWAQDTKDDSNSSPVFEWVSESEGYIYTAPSLHWTKDKDDWGEVSIYKLNALTGEIVWEKPYRVCTVAGVSGGVQSTPILGREGSDIEGLVIYNIARIPRKDAGVMVALDTETGEEVWRWNMDYYTWSSPVALYTESGKSYIVVCDASGYAYLMEGKTGKILSQIELGSIVEASPVAYENTLIVGTRARKICGIWVE